jgi:hypothetical protein
LLKINQKYMAKYFDEEGNAIDDVLSPEDAAKLREQAEAAEKKQADWEEKEAELERLRQKDMNFEKLRSKVEKEQAPATEPAPAPEAPTPEPEPVQEPEPVKISLEPSDTEKAMLTDFGVDDVDIEKKSMYYYRKLSDDVDDPEIQKIKMEEAIVMAKNVSAGTTGLDSAVSSTGTRSFGGGNETQESEASLEMRKKFGISDADKEKYGSDNWDPKYVNFKKSKE